MLHTAARGYPNSRAGWLMRCGGENRQVAEIQMPRRKVRNVAKKPMHLARRLFPHGDRRMNLSNRKPLYLALALTLAAPLAFAQSTTPQSATQDATNAATTATQDATQAATQDATQAATQDATQAATQDSMAQSKDSMSKDSMAQSKGEPEKKNWSDLDTDKNGTLSASEAASVSNLSSVFAKADANADGELTQDEYKAYLAANGKGGAKSDSGG
jgi:hypothetical protein